MKINTLFFYRLLSLNLIIAYFLELTSLSVLTYDVKNLSFNYTFPANENSYRKVAIW